MRTIIINGKVFSGNSMVNGRVISGGTGNSRKFDEVKSADCGSFDRIAINSLFADVNVSTANSSKAEAHLYGEAIVDNDVNFDVQIINRELRITLQTKGGSFNGNLKLDITVPKTKEFKVISVKNSSGDITLNEGISTDRINVTTKSGDVDTYATSNHISVSTMSGDVELCVNAKSDIDVEVSTMSGDVSAEFSNIGHLHLHTSTMSGDVKNRCKEKGNYTANVEISSMSGDIRIR